MIIPFPDYPDGFKVGVRFLCPHQGNPSGTETEWGPDTYTEEVYIRAKNVVDATTRIENHFKNCEGFAHIASCVECKIPTVIP